MQNLKILHVVNVPWFNAVAWYGVHAAYAQALLGHEVHVAGDPASPSLVKAGELGLTRVLRLHLSKPNPLIQLKSAFELKDYIEQNRIDVVNAHQGNGYYMIALAAKLAKNKPLLVRTRGDIRYPKNNVFNRMLYAGISDGIIATSHVTYQRMIDTFPISKEKIVTLLPGVDEKKFSRGDLNQEGLKKKYGVPPEAALFGLVGRLDKKKGHKIAISALKQLLGKGRDVWYVIAGPEQDVTYDELRTFAQDIGVADKVLFLGRVPDVREVMAACDGAIIASTESEAICRVGLEFMALSVPVIASRLNGIPDIVEHGVCGYLFTTGDEKDLARTLEQFMEKKASWPDLQKKARKRVEDRHTLSGLGRASIEFYQSLLNGKAR